LEIAVGPFETHSQCRLGLQLERADQIGNRVHLVPLEISSNARVDLRTNKRVIEQRRTHTDRGSTGNQKLDRSICSGDAALPDDWNIVRPGNVVNLSRLQEGDRSDRRPGQPAAHVADDRRTLFDVDCHAHQRINDGECVGAGLDTQAGVLGDIRLVGRQLRNYRFVRLLTTGSMEMTTEN